MLRRILLALSIAAGIAYLFLPHFAVKGCAVGALAVLAFAARNPILGLALALGSLGDVLLDLDPERLFVYGLGSFLIGHFVYIILFVRSRRAMSLSAVQLWATALVLAYAIAVSAWLIPSLGALIVPVAIYMCAITTMVLCAILARFPSPLVAAGAVLFLVSDSLLAVNKFKMPVPYHDFLIWSTYYLGQFGIARGFLKSAVKEAK